MYSKRVGKFSGEGFALLHFCPNLQELSGLARRNSLDGGGRALKGYRFTSATYQLRSKSNSNPERGCFLIAGSDM